MKPYVTDWHAAIVYALIILGIAYKAAYPYLNPDNLQWQSAIYYAALAIIGAVVYTHGIVSLKARVNALEIQNRPAQRSTYQ